MTMKTKSATVPVRFPTLAAWVAAFCLGAILAVVVLPATALVAADGAAAPLRASLLTQELGDPRAPGNVKLVVTLPEPFGSPLVNVTANDFDIYVYPATLSREEGLQERYRAGGLYLWRNAGRFFLDARVVPEQDREGPATVRVVYRENGTVVAEGEAEGVCRYAADLVDVILAVDISRSMLYNDPNKLRVAAARSFIETAREAGGIGRIGLVTFNHNATVNTPLLPLEQGEQLLAVLDKVGAAGMTNLDKPIDLALGQLAGTRRPVLILLTDGKNEGSEYQNTHLRAAEENVRIFSVGLSEQTDHRLLREMAEVTGGMYFKAVRDSDLPDIYARLAAELGKRQLLHAGVLGAEDGTVQLPIDGSVKRLAALTDGGARLRVRGPGTGMDSARESSRVHFGSPTPGLWDFTWERAVPGVSVLALSADTRFFLDVFPPQLRGEILSVGATLAEGAAPLRGADVWVQALPGIVPEPIQLFDDGRHGDGEADDGVYAGAVMLPNAPDQFDLSLRAKGAAWDYGDFVRQAAGLAIRSREPPPGRASLGGDVDFGVLFPGETGSAIASVDLDSRTPRQLFLELDWPDGGTDWPSMASRLAVDPGYHQFELEMTVPAGAKPGNYHGRFGVTDGAELGDSADARVRVGTVTFDSPGAVDLGDVPPGTFRSRVLTIPYSADKAAPLHISLDAGEELDVAGVPDAVAEGDHDLELEVVVSAPMGQGDGEYGGTIIVEAGPGRVDVPVRWRVRPYQARPRDVVPPAGIPDAPRLPDADDTRPLERTPDLSDDFWTPDRPAPLPDTTVSPWEETERVFRNTPRVAPVRPAASGAAPGFSSLEPVRRGDSLWSAWWIYLLAALLLLLLLLLLLAYILYRLGKSALARFLLVSALANVILLIVFIILLGTSTTVAPRLDPPVEVSLVAEEPPVTVQLSDAERELVGLTGVRSDSADGTSGVPGEVTVAEADTAAAAGAAASGGVVTAKENTVETASDDAGAALSDNLEPAAAPFEADRETAMHRREHQRERERERSEEPMRELPEMAEPPEETASARASETNRDRNAEQEARLDLNPPEDSERPVWSDGVRPVQPVASDQGTLITAAPGMEAVSFDRTVRRIDPRGRRRSPSESMVTEPEPRVDIDDPSRDREEQRLAEGPANPDGDPGVEEFRVDNLAVGVDIYGQKPGSAIPAGIFPVQREEPARLPRGVSGEDDSASAAPMGGRRTVRGSGRHEGAGSATPATNGMPGGSAGRIASDTPGGATGRANANGTAIDEMRFDSAPSGGGSRSGLPGATGLAASSQPLAGGDGGTSPNLAGGGTTGERAAFTPSAQGGGNGNGDASQGPLQRSDGRGPGERNAGVGDGNPDSLSSRGVPGLNDGNGQSGLPGGASGGDDSGRSAGGRGQSDGLGESRVDEMNSGPGRSPLATRTGTGITDLTQSNLGGDDDHYRLRVIPMDTTVAEWSRIERNGRRRSVSVAASSVDMDSLLIVVGDFARLPDSATENLFGVLSDRIRSGITVEDRRLTPTDPTLGDTLLALVAPEEMRDWSDNALASVGEYLKRGGHIWLDAADRPEARRQMERLAQAVGGEFGPLPATHQLSDGETVDAVVLNDRELVVATYQDWRREWRFGRRNGRTLRFLTRTLNYFLSGDADDGIVLGPGRTDGEEVIEPAREIIPDRLAGGDGSTGRLWDEFGPGTAATWRMPSWSDPGAITAISDGQGGRALKMDLHSAVKGRAAVYRTLTPPEDFSTVNYVSLDAYYDGAGDAALSMVFTVDDGAGWVDYETPALDLTPGWNRVRFDLDATNFRQLQPESRSGQPLRDSDRTGRAGFFLYREGEAPALVMYRNIRLHE